MNRVSAILGTIVFFFVAPGIVAGVIPWSLSGGRNHAWLPGNWILAAIGSALIVAGLAALIASFARFALEGRGTPAPIAPTAKLVTGGFYRFVRNPMYVALLSIILGQALVFASLPVLIYGVVVFAAVHAFVTLYEEPMRRAAYGASYDAYVVAVPRWIPRLTPWARDP
jgi:protein-S-isoprenylcysteine O-methyltransferase Ste14